MRQTLLALLAAALSNTVCAAGTGYVVFSGDFSSDQAASMDLSWYNTRFDGSATMHLFVFKSSKFEPVEDADEIKKYQKIVTASHGGGGRIGGVSGDDFAEAFKKAHETTPQDVYFIACGSSDKPAEGASVVGALAAKYKGETEGSTLIGKITGTKKACALRPPGTEPITQLEDAIYHQGVDTSEKGEKLVEELVKQWNDAKTHPYPGSEMSFHDYCSSMSVSKTATFVEETVKMFKKDYIALINENSGGTAPDVCGAVSETPCK